PFLSLLQYIPFLKKHAQSNDNSRQHCCNGKIENPVLSSVPYTGFHPIPCPLCLHTIIPIHVFTI
ncbi:hypothetical protein, partial [Eggerthella lenta]|uniref:hypothetical protein n=1 Tax=Eggerthella lenta TaxID=84112 RepID=UPI001D05CC73